MSYANCNFWVIQKFKILEFCFLLNIKIIANDRQRLNYTKSRWFQIYLQFSFSLRFVNIWVGLKKRKNVTKIIKNTPQTRYRKWQYLAKNIKMSDFEQNCNFNRKSTNYKHFTPTSTIPKKCEKNFRQCQFYAKIAHFYYETDIL